ncbi:MAG: putative lipoprotein [Frankiales bacterium]|nr:putative lipoprotein [Frankiales bacterium]
MPSKNINVARRAAGLLTLGLAAATIAGFTGTAAASPTLAPHQSSSGADACSPTVTALGFSDALDKLDVDGVTLGGLSDVAWDRRSGAYVSSVDNHGTDPARLWFYRSLASPRVVGAPLVLRAPNGVPYDGTTSDNEGLAVLPNGDFLVSSETEPSIRIFGRDGVQKSQLTVPARFAVAAAGQAGQATANATLEGLTVSPDGREIVAAMEGVLSGDEASIDTAATATLRRFLIYRPDRRGHWSLVKQVGYRVDAGNRISEVQLYGNDHLLVMEAAFSTTLGNTIQLYAVPSLDGGRDVSKVGNLSTHASLVLKKRLVADVTKCPSLGAVAKEFQSNPLMDNYEGLIVQPATGRHSKSHRKPAAYDVSLISDDNFSATQTTRVLRLAAFLP